MEASMTRNSIAHCKIQTSLLKKIQPSKTSKLADKAFTPKINGVGLSKPPLMASQLLSDTMWPYRKNKTESKENTLMQLPLLYSQPAYI